MIVLFPGKLQNSTVASHQLQHQLVSAIGLLCSGVCCLCHWHTDGLLPDVHSQSVVCSTAMSTITFKLVLSELLCHKFTCSSASPHVLPECSSNAVSGPWLLRKCQ